MEAGSHTHANRTVAHQVFRPRPTGSLAEPVPPTPPRPPCSPSEPPQPHDSWCLSGSWGQPSAPSAQGPAAPGPAPFLLGQFHIRGLVCLLLGGRPRPLGQFLTTSNVRKVVLSGDTRAFYKISHAFQTEALHSLSLKYCRVLLSSPQRTHRRTHVHARTQR